MEKKGYRMVTLHFRRTRDPGFKIGDRDLSVFIISELETLLLKKSEPETLRAKNFEVVV